MRIKMSNGVILESDNEMVNKMRLKNGGVEVKGISGSRKGGKKAAPKEKMPTMKKDASKDANENKEDADEDKK